MAHTIGDKAALIARTRRIRGQVEAIERAIGGDAPCEQVMHLLASTRAAIAGLMAEVVEGHVMTHLVDADRHPDALDPEAAKALVGVIRTYLR